MQKYQEERAFNDNNISNQILIQSEDLKHVISKYNQDAILIFKKKSFKNGYVRNWNLSRLWMGSKF